MANTASWVVHKFGGSSVADADCFRRVADIIESQPPGPQGVVLSACRGVTDALLRLVALAEQQDDSYRAELAKLRARHATIAETVLRPESARLYLAGFDRDCHDLEGILHTVRLTARRGPQRQRPDRRIWRAVVDEAVPSLFRGAGAAAPVP